jgi:hypothetical protein
VVVRGRRSKSRYGIAVCDETRLKVVGRAVMQAVIVIYCQLLQVLRRPVELTGIKLPRAVYEPEAPSTASAADRDQLPTVRRTTDGRSRVVRVTLNIGTARCVRQSGGCCTGEKHQCQNDFLRGHAHISFGLVSETSSILTLVSG